MKGNQAREIAPVPAEEPGDAFSSQTAKAGSNKIAPNMFMRNMNVSRMPMSAWNWSGEKIQVATPMASAQPVKITPNPEIASVVK
jgi:hypothetical protein